MRGTRTLSLAAVALALVGCGGGGGSNVGAFTGIWQYVSGQLAVTSCSVAGDGSTTALSGETMTLGKAASSDLTYNASYEPKCVYNLDIKGPNATLATSPPCMDSGVAADGTPYTVLVTPTSWLLTVTDTSMTENASVNLVYTFSGGGSESCVGSITGAALTKR